MEDESKPKAVRSDFKSIGGSVICWPIPARKDMALATFSTGIGSKAFEADYLRRRWNKPNQRHGLLKKKKRKQTNDNHFFHK